ncbi:hypothetical protein QJS10_CPA03g01152 [Acorus calamus]|uniref:Uncharacterized protein n=1 Tax=Acorus calamus TaxID=4465 RepID=A0AAV9FA80_ACOCL|nr:hypothetical protein QJS10_CPA03g01152 [Acorus calamus]
MAAPEEAPLRPLLLFHLVLHLPPRINPLLRNLHRLLVGEPSIAFLTHSSSKIKLLADAMKPVSTSQPNIMVPQTPPNQTSTLKDIPDSRERTTEAFTGPDLIPQNPNVASASTSQLNNKFSQSPTNRFSILQDISETEELTIKAAVETDFSLQTSNKDAGATPRTPSSPCLTPLANSLTGKSALTMVAQINASTIENTLVPQSTTASGSSTNSVVVVGSCSRIRTQNQKAQSTSAVQPAQTLQNSSQDEVFPPSYLFESPKLISEVMHVPMVDIPLEIDLFPTTLETSLNNGAARVRQGGGRNQKPKHKLVQQPLLTCGSIAHFPTVVLAFVLQQDQCSFQDK